MGIGEAGKGEDGGNSGLADAKARAATLVRQHRMRCGVMESIANGSKPIDGTLLVLAAVAESVQEAFVFAFFGKDADGPEARAFRWVCRKGGTRTDPAPVGTAVFHVKPDMAGLSGAFTPKGPVTVTALSGAGDLGPEHSHVTINGRSVPLPARANDGDMVEVPAFCCLTVWHRADASGGREEVVQPRISGASEVFVSPWEGFVTGLFRYEDGVRKEMEGIKVNGALKRFPAYVEKGDRVVLPAHTTARVAIA